MIIRRFLKTLLIAAVGVSAALAVLIYYTENSCQRDTLAVNWPLKPKVHCD